MSAAEPAPAQAWILGLPSPGQVVSGLLGGIGGAIGGTVGKLAVTAFDAIIHALFAPIAHFINMQLIGWLVAVPDYAPAGSHVAATERTVLAMAGAALPRSRRSRSRGSGRRGSRATAARRSRGWRRTVGAALVLPVWPWVFHAAVGLANEASTGLLGSGSVTKDSANLLALGVGAGVGLGFLGVGLFVSIVMAVVASILFLGLLMMKVVLAISTVLVFIGMPIAIVLWPVMPWVARVLGRAFGVCLAVPLVWSMCFAASGAMINDGLSAEGVLGVLRRVARAAGRDRAAVDHAAAADQARADRDARCERVGGRVRLPYGQLRGRVAAARRRPSAHAGLGSGGSARGQERTAGADSRLGARLGAESVLAASKVAVGGASGGAGGAAVGAGSSRTGAGRRRRAADRPRGAAERQTGRRAGRRSMAPGWLGRVRGCGQVECVLAAAAGGQPGDDRGARRATATDLAARGLRRGDARGLAARAAPAGVGRPSPAGARGAAGEHPGGNRAR